MILNVYQGRPKGTTNKYREIRAITPGTRGITIPEVIAEKFKDVALMIRVTETSIILESGCKKNG